MVRRLSKTTGPIPVNKKAASSTGLENEYHGTNANITSEHVDDKRSRPVGATTRLAAPAHMPVESRTTDASFEIILEDDGGNVSILSSPEVQGDSATPDLKKRDQRSPLDFLSPASDTNQQVHGKNARRRRGTAQKTDLDTSVSEESPLNSIANRLDFRIVSTDEYDETSSNAPTQHQNTPQVVIPDNLGPDMKALFDAVMEISLQSSRAAAGTGTPVTPQAAEKILLPIADKLVREQHAAKAAKMAAIFERPSLFPKEQQLRSRQRTQWCPTLTSFHVPLEQDHVVEAVLRDVARLIEEEPRYGLITQANDKKASLWFLRHGSQTSLPKQPMNGVNLPRLLSALNAKNKKELK